MGRGCSRPGGASVHTRTTGPGRAGCLTPGHRSTVQTAAPGPRWSCTWYTPWAPVRSLGRGASGRRRGCHTHCGLWEGGITLPDPLPCPSWAFLMSLPLSGACRPLLWVQALTGCSATGHWWCGLGRVAPSLSKCSERGLSLLGSGDRDNQSLSSVGDAGRDT